MASIIGLVMNVNETYAKSSITYTSNSVIDTQTIIHTHNGSTSVNGQCYRQWTWNSGHSSGAWWYTDSISNHDYTYLNCSKTTDGQDYGNCNGALNAGWNSKKSNGGHSWNTDPSGWSTCSKCGTSDGMGGGYAGDCPNNWQGGYTRHSHTTSCLRDIPHVHGGGCYATGNSGHGGGCPTHHCGVNSSGSSSCGYYSVNCGHNSDTVITVTITKKTYDKDTLSDGTTKIGEYILTLSDVANQSYSSAIDIIWDETSSDEIVITANGTHTFTVTYIDDAVEKTKKLSYTVTDFPEFTSLPTPSTANFVNAWSSTDITATANAINATRYALRRSDCDYPNVDAYQVSSVLNIEENGFYDIMIRDDENITVSQSFTVENIDKIEPVITKVDLDKYTYINYVRATVTGHDVDDTLNYTFGGNSIPRYATSGVAEFWYEYGGVASTHITTSTTTDSSDITATFTLNKNGVYTFYIKDKAGNVSTFDYTVSNIDIKEPKVTNVQVVNDTTIKTTITVEDDYKLGGYVYLGYSEANPFSTYTLYNILYGMSTRDSDNVYTVPSLISLGTGKTYTLSGADFNYTENGYYAYAFFDSTMQNINFHIVSVGEVEEYTLKQKDEDDYTVGWFDVIHEHQGNSGTQALCYKGVDQNIYNGYGTPQSGHKYALNCGLSDQIIGAIEMLKVIDMGQYKLQINKIQSTADHLELLSYSWSGTPNSLSQSWLPSATLLSGTTDIVTIQNFGVYSCVVGYKDTYTGKTYTTTIVFDCEDFDLESPQVTMVKRHYHEYENLAGAEFTPLRDASLVTPLNKTDIYGFEDNDVMITVDGNDINPYETEEEIEFYISDNMSLDRIECVETGKTYTLLESEKNYGAGLAGEVTAVISDKMLGLTKFDANGTYHFKLFDMLQNEFDFTVRISKVDDGSLKIASVTSTPSSETLAKEYVLKVSVSDSYSQCYYQFLRMWEDDNLDPHYEVYKDWSTESFCSITDNGYYAVKVVNSSFAKDVVNDETNPLKLYDKRFKKVWTFNGDYTNYKLTYSLCDTTAPVIKDLKIKANADMVIVTVVAKDDYSDSNKLKYTCDKAYKQKDNIFYITTNGYYTFAVTDECGNTSTKTVYIDLSEYGLKDYGIIKDIKYDYLGNTYKADGLTYTDSGVEVSLIYMDDVDSSLVLTKLDDNGKYANTLKYKFTENGTHTIYSRNTALENENMPEVLYKDKVAINTIDMVAPSVTIQVKDNKAYITAEDNGSGVGYINVLTTSINGSVDDKVDYSGSRKPVVTYVLPLEYNVIQTISIVDNVGNQSTEYSISTDGVLTGGFKDLFVVVFIDSNQKVLSEQILLKGANAVAPNVPIREGHTFERWSVDFTNVSNNLTVYPVYRNDVTKELDLTEVMLDKSWHIALLGHSFAYSTGGDSNVNTEDANSSSNTQFTIGASVEELSKINLSNYANTVNEIQRQFYAFSGLSLIVMILLIYVFNKLQERAMLKKERL